MSPTGARATWSKPASVHCVIASTKRSGSGPQGIASATSPGRTLAVAASKLATFGSSDITFQPGAEKRKYRCAASTAATSSSAAETANWPMWGRPAPSASNRSTSAASGSVATRPSPARPASAAACGPPAAT